MLLVVFCWVAAMASLLFAASSGDYWPVPFALFMVVVGGIFHLIEHWYKRP